VWLGFQPSSNLQPLHGGDYQNSYPTSNQKFNLPAMHSPNIQAHRRQCDIKGLDPNGLNEELEGVRQSYYYNTELLLKRITKELPRMHPP
jgi:hypothetical protein